MSFQAMQGFGDIYLLREPTAGCGFISFAQRS
jgi:hypothetical protein